MGLLRAAIFFLLGNFYISLIDKHLNKLKDIYILGDLYGDSSIDYIKKNKSAIIVILLSITAIII